MNTVPMPMNTVPMPIDTVLVPKKNTVPMPANAVVGPASWCVQAMRKPAPSTMSMAVACQRLIAAAV